jgi:hypothetical protein
MKRLVLLAFLVSLGGSVQAAAPEIRAWAFCPMTHVMGHGKGSSLDIAEDRAIKDCIAKGGLEKCCHKFFGEGNG